MLGNEITKTLIISAAGILSAGFPILKLFWDNRKKKRGDAAEEIKQMKLENAELKERLEQHEKNINELRIRLSIIIPIVKSQNPNNEDLLELMTLLERDTGMNNTSKG
ncbi:hypothetical protein INR75_06595 [Zunongwangia sp. SCSIO 43204]|uniref:hypothetical protein n=1 Tax=Zunongwangia sp. SCSIO 43204 TaxID=2779359 RepID=UPI001CA810B9|nr:hypothetical protein [Zunongwangia sp. SCSIO 43204]UAB85677.1 hypothetical protein INR75_06595 [Zunongwangia sp. SCSIO 43204]